MSLIYPRISVMDMHTGGEPLRIVRAGYPVIPGATILDKRRYAREHLDHLRRFIMFEPRGHTDMYGAILVPPSIPQADLAVLFIHNEGYSTMCGHGVIALGRFAVDHGFVRRTEPITTVRIECPCGLVTAYVEVNDGTSGRVSFDSVPAFLFADNLSMELDDGTRVGFQIAFGGAYYALAEASQFGLDVRTSRLRDLVEAADGLSTAVRAIAHLSHPLGEELAFLYGTILTDGRDLPVDGPSRNLCVFADAEADRSPTGSGVTARMAARFAQGKIGGHQTCLFESVTGAEFEAEVVGTTRYSAWPAVVVRVSGRAHYTGEATYWMDSDDGIGEGFRLR